MEEEIQAELERSGFRIDPEHAPDVLSRLLGYCINHNLSAADLVSNWELYYLNRQLDGLKLEISHMDGFLSYLQNELKERIIKEDSHVHSYSSNEVEQMFIAEPDADEALPNTPIPENDAPHLEPKSLEFDSEASEKPSSSRLSKSNGSRITPFGQRIKKFAQQYVYNANFMDIDVNKRKEETEEDIVSEDDFISKTLPIEKCSLQSLSSHPEPGCRFMHDRIQDRFDFLEKRIKKCTDLFASSGRYGEPTDATLASEKNVFTVGMIHCDGEGRLNDKSVLLQGSVEHSRGQRVRLDLQGLSQFSLYPGQVIGIEGHNPSGHCLIAYKLADSLPRSVDLLRPVKKHAVDTENQKSHLLTEKVLSLIIAAGPFTTVDNLLFEPLQELLSYVSRRQPHLVVLMGPFVDSEHPEIKTGTVDRSDYEVFHNEIIRKLQDFIQFVGSSVRLVLIPSTRDAHHDFIFPQPAFDLGPSEYANDQITSLANPGLFNSNEVVVGYCTLDILKQLSGEEISRNPDHVKSDRVGRLAMHLLRQHSFYPLYPPSADIPLDFSLAPGSLEIPSVPDVLLLPSDLAAFVKVLSLEDGNEVERRVLCINPGRLAKGVGGGTFVELHYREDVHNSAASIIRI